MRCFKINIACLIHKLCCYTHNYTYTDYNYNDIPTIINLNNNKISQHVTLFNTIGKGKYGKVKIGQLINSQVICAVKIIYKKKCNNHSIQNEVNILNVFNITPHINIIKLLQIYEDDDKFYILQEYCDGGDLHDLLYKTQYLKESNSILIIKILLKTIEYCHSIGIVHRDIKPENIMLGHVINTNICNTQNDTNNYSNIKLIDFGLSYKSYNLRSEQIWMSSRVGTCYYIAPEVLNHTHYNQSCDLWSIGIIMYSMISGIMPFYGNNNQEVIEYIIIPILHKSHD